MSNRVQDGGYLLLNRTTTGTDPLMVKKPIGTNRLFQINATCSGTGSVTVKIEVSTNKEFWNVAHTVEISSFTTSETAACATDTAWTYVRANVTAISGTETSVSVLYGVAD